jgi:hypothetical protein
MNKGSWKDESEHRPADAASVALHTPGSWVLLTAAAVVVVWCAAGVTAGTTAGDRPPAPRAASAIVASDDLQPVPGGEGVGFQGGAAVGKPSIAVIPGRKFTALENTAGQSASGQALPDIAATSAAFLDSEVGEAPAPPGLVRPLADNALRYFAPAFEPRTVSDCWPTEAAPCGDLVYSNTVLNGYFMGFHWTGTCMIAKLGDDAHLVPGGPRKACQVSIAVAGRSSPEGGTMTVTGELYSSCVAGVLVGPIFGTSHAFTDVPRDGNGYILTYPVNVVTFPDNVYLGIVVSGFPVDDNNDGGPLLCGPPEGPGSTDIDLAIQFTGTGCPASSCHYWFGGLRELEGFYLQIRARADDPVGACCGGTLSGSCTCSDITLSLCNASEGVFVGAGTTCVDMMPACGRGACWYSNCSCADDTTQAVCAAMGGLEFKLGELCDACNHDCCKGDTNLDTRVDGEDIPSFIDALVSVPECATAQWCAANMDDDLCVNMVDLNLFVSALLSGDGCGTPK